MERFNKTTTIILILLAAATLVVALIALSRDKNQNDEELKTTSIESDTQSITTTTPIETTTSDTTTAPITVETTPKPFIAPDGSEWESEVDYWNWVNDSFGDSDYYIAPDGSLWDSKELYDQFINPQGQNNPPPLDGNCNCTDWFHDPQGYHWANEEDYLNFIAMH